MFLASRGRCSCTITPEMLHHAVEELAKWRAQVSAEMIANYLRRHYPVEQDPAALKIELKDKLDHAVSVGVLSRCNKDAYCLPTMRQEAYNYKTDLSSFWERYYRKRPGRRLRSTRLASKRRSTSTLSSSDTSDDCDF